MKLSELFQQNGFDLGNLKESFGLIDGISEHIIAASDEVLAKQHQISENIYFNCCSTNSVQYEEPMTNNSSLKS